MAKNHLASLRKCGITNHCSYVTDEESFIELTNLGYPVIYMDHTDTSKHNFNFGSDSFNNLSYLRYHVINTLFKTGIDVWYLDVDTVVLKDLTPIYLELKTKCDICFQSDLNMLCTGCMLLFATENSTKFVNDVINNTSTNHNDQICVNKILNQNSNNLKIKVFSYLMFPNGLLYFGEDVPKIFQKYKKQYTTNRADTYLLHSNLMIGDDTKTQALKKYGLLII